MSITGPEAVRDDRSAAFYDAAARDQLLIRRCASCDKALAPEARTCTGCGERELMWMTASGTAMLISWATVHHPPLPAFGDQVPFPIGLVELAEGPWLHARIVPGDEPLRAGLRLCAEFVHPEEGESYPVFVQRESGWRSTSRTKGTST